MYPYIYVYARLNCDVKVYRLRVTETQATESSGVVIHILPH
jgi:hypothetical protein